MFSGDAFHLASNHSINSDWQSGKNSQLWYLCIADYFISFSIWTNLHVGLCAKDKGVIRSNKKIHRFLTNKMDESVYNRTT